MYHLGGPQNNEYSGVYVGVPIFWEMNYQIHRLAEHVRLMFKFCRSLQFVSPPFEDRTSHPVSSPEMSLGIFCLWLTGKFSR